MSTMYFAYNVNDNGDMMEKGFTKYSLINKALMRTLLFFFPEIDIYKSAARKLEYIDFHFSCVYSVHPQCCWFTFLYFVNL